MSLDGQLIAPSPVDTLLSKLEEPRVVAALNDILEHADLLAILVTGLDGFVRRGEVITDSLAKALQEVRGDGASSALGNVDLAKLAASLSDVAGALGEAGPALARLLRSDLTDPRVIDVIATGAKAIAVGAERTATEPTKLSGVFSLMRTLKDEDVARGLSFFIHTLRALGRDLPSESA